MVNRNIKIAIIPTRRGISSNRKGAFTIEDALGNKKSALKRIEELNIKGVEFITIDWLNEEGMLSDVNQVDDAYEGLKNQNIDAVFIMHTNFGCEEAVGRLCKLMKKPVLLWGPLDRAIEIDGSRSTDTQCGLFASSRLLSRYGIKFSYIENCDVDDTAFADGIIKFISVVNVVTTMSDLRIGQINSRPKYFTSVMVNESELMEKFGVEVVPLNITFIIDMMNKISNEQKELVDETISDTKRKIDCSSMEEEKVKKVALLKLALLELVKVHKLNALAIECWTLLPKMIDILPCYAMGELTDLGIPCACETDINGAISSILLQAAGMDKISTFFGEYTMRHNSDPNKELIWHCGNAPLSLKDPSSEAVMLETRSVFNLRQGSITIVRFDGINGKYYLFAGEAQSVEGPKTTQTYTWSKMDDWKKWEKKFIFGPYIHHVSVGFGKYSEILKESCNFMENIEFDSPDIVISKY